MITTPQGATFPCTTNLEPYRRVRYNSGTGTLVYAGAAEKADGTLAQRFNTDNDTVASVIPWHNQGMRKMVAGGAIAAYGYYTNGANGKIVAEADPLLAKGRLHRQAATADGDIVEVSPFSDAD